MKALQNTLAAVVAVGAFAAGAQVASAASLGAIEYGRWTNNTYMMQADLGGVKDTIADATITYNDYNGAATLPGGIPNNYSIHIDRTFLGDGNTSTADLLNDKYWFKVDPTTMGGASTSMADTTLTIVKGYDTGIANVNFALYEADEDGNWVGGGGPFAQLSGAGGQIMLGDIDPAHKYMLRVTGNLKADAEATNVGRYDIVLGLSALSPVPVPPAILLLLTGLGALFGYRRVRHA